MAVARIIDESGRGAPWITILKESLSVSGFELTTQDDESANLTILMLSYDQEAKERLFRGDLLVLSIPSVIRPYDKEQSRMEIIGTNRIKVRYTLSDPEEGTIMPDEIKSLVKLFI